MTREEFHFDLQLKMLKLFWDITIYTLDITSPVCGITINLGRKTPLQEFAYFIFLSVSKQLLFCWTHYFQPQNFAVQFSLVLSISSNLFHRKKVRPTYIYTNKKKAQKNLWKIFKLMCGLKCRHTLLSTVNFINVTSKISLLIFSLVYMYQLISLPLAVVANVKSFVSALRKEISKPTIMNSRGFYAVSQHLLVPGKYMVPLHSCRQNTHTYNINIISQKILV